MNAGRHLLRMKSGRYYTTKTLEWILPPMPSILNVLFMHKTPPAYAMDREYRYVLKCQRGTKKEEFLTLDVGTCADICSLILL
jgi:hypothetical protein